MLCLTAALYFRAFGVTPIYLGGDEARFATAAASIAQSGRSLNGDRLPLFFHLTDSLDIHQTGVRWYQPLLFYLIALVLKILPLSEAAIRIPTAIIGVLDVFLIYGVARRLFRSAVYATLAAMVLALTPAHLIFARQALDYICPLPFVLGWLWCLVETLETGSAWASLGSGMLLGLGFYSYIAAWAMMPACLVLTCLVQCRSPTRRWVAPLTALVGFALPLMAFVPWVWSHPEMWRDTIGRYHVYDVHLSPLQGAKDFLNYNNVQERISVYWDYFNPAFLFFSGGSNITHGTRQVGVFLLPICPLVVSGIFELWNRGPRAVSIVLLAGLALAPVPATLVDERYAIQRALLLLPFVVLISVFGLEFLLRQAQPWIRLGSVALLVVMPLQYVRFYSDYFSDYRIRSAVWFDPVNFRGVAEFLLANQTSAHPLPVYLSQDLDDGASRWMFYLAKHHREELLPMTRMFEATGLDLTSVRGGSLLVLYANEPAVAAWTAANAVSVAAVIKHVSGAPSAVILQKID